MGKTKTAFVSDLSGERKSSEEEYRLKKERQAVAAKDKQGGKPEKVHIAGLKGGQRIKMVEAEVTPAAEDIKITSDEDTGSSDGRKKTKKPVQEKIRGKKYQEAKKKIKPGETYSISEAIKLVKETSYSKFDGTFEAHFTVKKTGISANVTLPHAGGRAKKIEVADDETIKKLASGKIDFDILLSTSEMMPKLVPFAKVLGPKGLMPNPKNGTLIKSAADAKKFGGNTLNLKTEREAPLVHTAFGKVSQKDTELNENLQAIVKALGGSKQIVKGFIKSTMSPAVRIAI